MAEPLVNSLEIVRRVMNAECRYTLSRLKVLERLPKNPVGIAYKELGGAFALSARYLPVPSMNRVTGLTDDQADEVPGLIDWFESRGIVGQFEIIPGFESAKVMAALAKAGYAQTGFHAVLFGAPAPAPPPAPGVSVDLVTRETLEEFLDAYCAGRQVADRDGFKNNVRGWLGEPGWSLYLGRYEGKPAGSAILYMDERTGYCADSAVDPALRGHGVHQALLARRSADALAHGDDLLCAMADYLSTSQRNMIRAGLSVLHTKAIWTRVR